MNNLSFSNGMRRLRRVFSTGCLLCVVVTCLALAGCGPARETGVYRVVKVYDGDTVRLDNGEKVRLIGIDTPEVYDNEKLLRDTRKTGVPVTVMKEQGALASQFAEKLLLGRLVRLQFDEERKDVYGRLLAYLWTPVPENWGELRPDFLVIEQKTFQKEPGEYIFVNASMMKAGYARPMAIPPNTLFADWFAKLYREAQRDGRGIWSGK